MERNNEIVQILKEQYGIRTLEELNKAISKLRPIDLTPFVGEVINQQLEKRENLA